MSSERRCGLWGREEQTRNLDNFAFRSFNTTKFSNVSFSFPAVYFLGLQNHTFSALYHDTSDVFLLDYCNLKIITIFPHKFLHFIWSLVSFWSYCFFQIKNSILWQDGKYNRIINLSPKETIRLSALASCKAEVIS